MRAFCTSIKSFPLLVHHIGLYYSSSKRNIVYDICSREHPVVDRHSKSWNRQSNPVPDAPLNLPNCQIESIYGYRVSESVEGMTPVSYVTRCANSGPGFNVLGQR